MTAFIAELKLNIRHRACDGFAVGYNIVFPAVMIGLLGVLCRNFYHGGISSFQYYTVVTIPFCIVMVAIIAAAYAGKDDAYAKTAERVLLAPVSVRAIVAAKILSCTLVISLCSILTYTVAAAITGIGIRKMLYISLLLLLLSYMIAAIGTCIGLGMKNFLTVKNVMNIPLGLFGIMGGVFFPIGTIHLFGNVILNLSPFRWINRCMFLMLYDGRTELLLWICLILAVVGSLFGLVSVVIFKKEEYCNGSLPGYEK